MQIVDDKEALVGQYVCPVGKFDICSERKHG